MIRAILTAAMMLFGAAEADTGDLDSQGTYDTTVLATDSMVSSCLDFVFDGDGGKELRLRFCGGEMTVTGDMPKDKSAKEFLDYLALDFKARCAKNADIDNLKKQNAALRRALANVERYAGRCLISRASFWKIQGIARNALREAGDK